MCGIVGYVGDKQALPILLEGLRKLEYRGYDSCGVAVASDEIHMFKDAIRVDVLSDKSPRLAGSIGIGHTRWATHGRPSKINAHPHQDCSGRIAVVHNGVISNYKELRTRLVSEGHTFLSETDTEVIPHLVEKHYHGNLAAAVEKAIGEIEGSYAMIAMIVGEPRLVVARKDSPVVIGIGDRSNFIASDVPALLDHTNRVLYLEDGDIAVVDSKRVSIRHDGAEVRRQEQQVLWNVDEAKKGGYEHFMLKEIHEQPRVIRNTIGEYARPEQPIAGLPTVGANSETVTFLACGTSYHAALVGKHIFEDLLKTPARAEIASEFNYHANPVSHGLAIGITQSGETADTLKAMRKVKESGSRVVAITNVVGSTASRVAHQTLYTRAGPEISVAATKSFTAQLMVLYLMALSLSKAEPRKVAELNAEMRQLPSKVDQVIDNEGSMIRCGEYLAGFDNVFYVGRGVSLAVALEGALKLKETSYIHAEGLAAGEMKHGTLAVLSEKTPVVAVLARDSTYEPTLTNIKEINARGAPIVAVAPEADGDLGEFADIVVEVPRVDPIFAPVVSVVALHLIAYYAAKKRGCPIDFPRNLAKSVTVE